MEATPHAIEDRHPKERPAHRQLARPAVPLRLEIQPRQGPAHVLRGEHAARRAVRARRRHSGSGAGGRLRSRAGRLERRRGKAARLRGTRHRAAVRNGADCWISAAASCASRCRMGSTTAAPPRSPASASRPPTRTSSDDFLPSAASGPRSWCSPAAVEIAPRLGRADLICDLVSTGSTLAANHLRQAESVLESQAVLIRTPVPIPDEKQDWTRRLLMRIDGVEQVKGSKYIMLHAPRSALPAIAKLLPGSEAPDGHSSRRPRRPGRGACRVPRKRVLGDSRTVEKRRRELRAGAAGRENAGLSGQA